MLQLRYLAVSNKLCATELEAIRQVEKMDGVGLKSTLAALPSPTE